MKLIIYLLFLLILTSCKQVENDKKNSDNKIKSESLFVAELAPVIRISLPKSDSIQLVKLSKRLMKALADNNITILSQNSIDTINCQACKSFKVGTSIEDIHVRKMLPIDFLTFYRDSFLFPKLMKYPPLRQYEIDIFIGDNSHFEMTPLFNNDSNKVYSTRFINQNSEIKKRSLTFCFVKIKNTFKFFGLYL
jgi:hypothetical protein